MIIDQMVVDMDAQSIFNRSRSSREDICFTSENSAMNYLFQKSIVKISGVQYIYSRLCACAVPLLWALIVENDGMLLSTISQADSTRIIYCSCL